MARRKNINEVQVMAKSKQPTIKDVSSLAGVGISTVSRYINKSGYVSEEVSAKIEQAINELKFVPSNYARILKGSITKTLTLIVPDIMNPYYAEMYSTIQQLAEEREYYVYLYQSRSKEESELKAVMMCGRMSSDGVIFCSDNRSKRVEEALKELHTPTVVSHLYEDELYFDTIYSQDGEGIYLMTRYLLEHGHTRIGYAGGSINSYINEKRRNGYKRALKEAGAVLNEDYIFEMDFSVNAGYRAGKYFTTLKERPTAICSANDLIALGVITGLMEQEVKVPEEISVSGEDNIEFGKLWKPSLTTVDNSGSKFGELACEMLFERIMDGYEGEPRAVRAERKIVERLSTRSLIE